MYRIQLVTFLCLLIPLTSLAQIFTLHPPNTTRIVDTDISIDCSIVASEITVRWRKDSDILSPSSSSYEILTVLISAGLSSQFHIFSGEFANTGVYTCLAYNDSVFLAESYPGTLTMEGPVHYIEDPLDQVVYLNQPIILVCHIQGSPLPTLKWTHDVTEGNIDVVPGGLTSIITNRINAYETSSKLTISNAQLTHDSTYHCETENSYGSADRTARITVQDQEIESVSIAQPVHGTVYPLIAHDLNSITLPCSATGLPKPTLQWEIPASVQTANVRVNQATLIPTLYISAPTLADAGIYTCIANNTFTYDVASIEVVVIETPVVSTSSDSVVTADSSVTLFCSATGTPTPTVTLIHPDDTILNLDVNGYVTISVISYLDEGTYTCLAVTQTVSSDATFFLTVYSEPVIAIPPTDKGVGIGQDVSFSCIVAGTPTPSITWIHNTHTIIQAPIPSTLRLSNVHSSDQGIYTCMATNLINSINATAILTIYPIPQFAITPTTTLAGVGDSVTFKCSANDATTTVEWYVDNILITSGIKYFVISDSLVIYNLVLSDSNSYTCRISNPAGELEASAILNIILRPYFLQTPLDQTVEAGIQVTFTCSVSGSPDPILSWLDGSDSIVETNGKFTVSMDSNTITLTITDVTLTEAGTYTCLADNGLEASRTALLSIINAPQVTIIPAIQKAILGQQFILTCEVTYSVPYPSFQWYNNSLIITTDDRVKRFANGSLVFSNVMLSDEGEYLCIAINTEGTGDAKANVEIIVTPTFSSTQTQHHVALGSDITLPCSSAGVPSPVTSWLLPDNTAAPNDGHFSWSLAVNGSLTIRDVLGSDHGSYTCVAMNEAGVANLQIFLTVQVAPDEPYNLTVVIEDASNVTITWIIPFNGYSAITGYMVRQNIVGGDVMEAEIEWEDLSLDEGEFDSAIVMGLIPFEFYRFRVAAVNEIGIGSYSDLTAKVQLFSSFPPAPENVTTQSLNSTAILIIWDPPTYPHGVILEHVIEWGIAGEISFNNTIPISQGTRYILTSLSIYTEYCFIIRAVNDNPFGGVFNGFFSEPVYQYTGEGPPVGPPLNVTLTTVPGGIIVIWNAPRIEFRQGIIIAYNLFYRPSLLNIPFPTLPPFEINQTNHSLEILNAYRKELMEYYQFGNISYTLFSIAVKTESFSHTITLEGLAREDYYYDIKLQAINSAGIGPNSTAQSAKSGFNYVNLLPIILPSILVPVLILACIVISVIVVLILLPYYKNWKETARNRKPYRETGSARRPLVPSSSLQVSNFDTENRGFDDIIRKQSSSAKKRDSPTGNESYLAAINEINRQIMESVGESDQEATPTGSEYSDSEGSGSMSGINTEVFTSNKPTDSDGAHVIYNYDSVMPKVGEEKTGTTKQTDFDDVVGDTIREAPVLQAGNYSDDDDDDGDDDDDIRLADSQTPADFYPHENSDLSDDERVTYGDYLKNVSADQDQPHADSEVSLSQYSHISFEFSRAKKQMANLKMEDKNIKVEKKRLDQEKKLREKIAFKERKARELRAKSERKEREKEAKQRLKERQQSYIPPSSLDPDLKYKDMSATRENKNRDVLF
ncbi:Down syndrome cell adhesion molecule [Oopsacas minuta]|uniref:Down syndrome cell adhesion molecule n=1 Tax=Oopsacas minuta TaxID=111878 RepID=A0AAV7K1B1_9METZ|nr:Down syndrome cell adhesion molecule [Oopsacas minuta]